MNVGVSGVSLATPAIVKRSPGPGMVRDRSKFRDVRFEGDVGANDITLGQEVQKDL